MAEKGNNKSKLVNEAINTSIEFEELMDQTDFESWLENDTIGVLKQMKQEVAPFKNFEENRKKLRSICERMKQKGIDKFCKTGNESSLEKYLVHRLFEAKAKRLNARISFATKEQRDYYEKAIYALLDALNHLPKWEGDKNCREYWLILCYNDLSICYAGLKNSSISRGYAEEAKKIIEEKKRYKEFDKEFNSTKTTGGADMANHDFVSSKLYDLYVIAVFNQAQAEKRSYQTSEAERDFKRIIDYACKSELINFNYYSALVNLSVLYIDQGRGWEALELSNKVTNDKNENDIRYWEASLAKIEALIDQSEYHDARELLEEFIEKRDDGRLIPKKEHKLTWAGFKALGFFARSYIEEVSNNPKMSEEEKKRELKIPEKFINENIGNIRDRQQKGFEQKAYKYLSDIHAILNNEQAVKSNLTRCISMGEIDDLCKLVKHERMEDWINKCEDLDVLESFVEQICRLFRPGETLKKDKKALLGKIVDKIQRECEDKDFLARVEKTIRKTQEVLEKEKVPDDWTLKNKKKFDGKKRKFFSCKEEKNIDVVRNMRRRLDVNEKKFDELLFERLKKMKKPDHLVEVIVLRRWNSFSPGLSRRLAESLGGGYLLRINKGLLPHTENGEEKIENIVIDPGYNFLQNFCGEEFSVEDIDTIIVTHSHLDHCSELLPIMDLMFQINKRNKKSSGEKKPKKKVTLCLSRGAYKKFFSYTRDMDWQEQLKDTIILENLEGGKWKLSPVLTISAIPTRHVDLGGEYAIGLKIGIEEIRGNNKGLCLGFTSDTPWYPKIRGNFEECDLLCVHLGSIKYQEIGYTDKYDSEDKEREIPMSKQFGEVKKLYTETGHLLCFGTEDVIASCVREKKDVLIIVGEFGEELKYGLRTDLCDKLSRSTTACCIPGDIGLYIGIGKDRMKKVRCNFCEEFVGQEDIKTFSYGREDALQYICDSCNSTLSELQKQAIVEHRLTKH